MNSEIEKFYEKPWQERIETIARECALSEEEKKLLESIPQDKFETLNRMSENVLGEFALPFSIALNFKINGKDFFIPMAIEEASVVAAASKAAKLARKAGGFQANASEQHMIGQIVLTGIKNKKAVQEIKKNKKQLLEKASSVDSVLKEKGGGAIALETIKQGEFLEIRLVVNVLDAMGANAVNTMCEKIAPEIEEITKGKALMRIISNHAVKRIARASAVWKKEDLGKETIERIIKAQKFAEKNIFRAVTHNKGIMNGITALAIATGNDFRAIEAGAHAFAAKSGKYKPLTRYWKNKNGDLVGEIELPVQAGIVGGTTKSNPMARLGLKILGAKNAKELCECFAAVGLAQNFAALRAIVSEGIQKGHMKLHAENIAVQAGAQGEEIKTTAEQMIRMGKISEGEARNILKKMREAK
ncbi:MAG: hydroxymethylglutaryl-CoA reductase, degradative [Candidatus Diapherotrites archaeon]